MENSIQKIERLIREIHSIHAQYSQDDFETSKVVKVNLFRIFANTHGMDFFYRVITRLINKIWLAKRFQVG